MNLLGTPARDVPKGGSMNRKSKHSRQTGSQDRVMTPRHPRWQQFLNQLCGPKSLGGSLCQKDHRFSRRILRAMGGIDVAASIAFFKEHGGLCCDCEVVMNVAGDMERLVEAYRRQGITLRSKTRADAA
jgi:hypothetical protein